MTLDSQLLRLKSNEKRKEITLAKKINQKILTLIYDKTFYANQGNNKNFNGNSNNFTRLV